MINKLKKLKDENKILIMLAFFSISVGLWGNFRQLWLQDTGLAVSQISNLLSIATFVCSGFAILFAKFITIKRIKSFISFCLIIKIINFIALFLCYSTPYSLFLSLFTIVDVITEKLIILSIYPFLVTIKKSDNLYSKRKLVEYLFRDIGILIGGISIGKVLFHISIDYNLLLLISDSFLLISFILLQNIKQTNISESKTSAKCGIYHLLHDKLLVIYLLCYFISNIAMNTGLGLKMLMLTDSLNFSVSTATNYLLGVGLVADFIGILALKYFTPKNAYLTIFLKFGLRFLGYVIAFFTKNTTLILITITWSILISTAYENIIDAPYINRVKCEYQFLFTNIRYIIGMIAESIGLFFAGITYSYGISYMLGLSAFFMIFQIALFLLLTYMRQKEKENYKKDTTYANQGVIISYYQMH